jgi:hypothetical protein
MRFGVGAGRRGHRTGTARAAGRDGTGTAGRAGASRHATARNEAGPARRRDALAPAGHCGWPGGALWAVTWGLVFGAATVWFAARMALSYRASGRLRPVGSHHLPHLIMSGTMVYMLASVARPAQLSGAGAAAAAGPAVHFLLLALILAQFMVGYVM